MIYNFKNDTLFFNRYLTYFYNMIFSFSISFPVKS